MYKEYSVEHYYKVERDCADRMRNMLLSRLNELETLREAINDRYPYEDLYLKYAAVDYEKELLQALLKHLELYDLEHQTRYKSSER